MNRTGLMVAALAVASCAPVAERSANGSGSMPQDAVALADASGARKGTATLRQNGGSVRVEVMAEGMPPGTYGAHLHMVGRCDAPGFESAGGHWNPTTRQHGRDNPAGAHLGDMPNLVVGPNGRGRLSFAISGASLSGGAQPIADADGTALLIHAGPDDYRTDPSGNSGARIACGVVGRPG